MYQADMAESVSVVMGVYNAERWIRDALDSVVKQTHPVGEIIVVDDGSTDDTPRIASTYGGIVKYLREEHRGRPHRNRGIVAAHGSFVAFIDGDDYWHPQKLELQLAVLIPRQLSWAICEAQWVDAETGNNVRNSSAPIQDGDILESLILHNFIVASTVVVAKSVFAEVGYFDEGPDFAAVEDWEFWLRIAGRHPVGCIRQKLCSLRLHGDSFLAALPTGQRVRHLENVIEGAVRREPARLAPLRGQALANVSYAAGVQCFRRLQMGEARQYFLTALQHRPMSVSAIGYVVLTLLGPALGGGLARLKRRLWNRPDEDAA